MGPLCAGAVSVRTRIAANVKRAGRLDFRMGAKGWSSRHRVRFIAQMGRVANDTSGLHLLRRVPARSIHQMSDVRV
jgi:hypothetical protein